MTIYCDCSNPARAAGCYTLALDLFQQALARHAARGDRARWTALRETCREVRGQMELLADG